jgi:hypothetical protein
MKTKTGIDLSINTQIKDNYAISLKSFPVAMYSNQPYRNNTIHDLNFLYSKKNFKMEEFKLFINKELGKIINQEKTFLYVTQDSPEHHILENSPYEKLIHFSGNKIKRENLKKLNKELNEAKRIGNKKDTIKDNSIIFEIDFNTEENFKTHEIVLNRYENYIDYNLNKNKTLSNNYLMHSTEKDQHDWFIEVVEPHVFNAIKEKKDVYLFTRAFYMPYVFSLNNKLKSKGLPLVIPRRKNKPSDKIKKELSYCRIREHMKSVYEDLINLQDKHVIYCDAGSFEQHDKKFVNSTAFILHEYNKLEIKGTNIESDLGTMKSSAEIGAFLLAINYVCDNQIFDKKIHFVFDSDTCYKILNNIKNNVLNKFPEQNKELCMELNKKIKLFNLKIEGTVVKSHQSITYKEKHPVIRNNDNVDFLVKQNYQNNYMNKEPKINSKLNL